MALGSWLERLLKVIPLIVFENFAGVTDSLNSRSESYHVEMFDQSLKVNSNIIDLNYLLNANYGDSVQNQNLFNAFQEIEYFDSSKYKEEIVLQLFNYVWKNRNIVRRNVVMRKVCIKKGIEYLEVFNFAFDGFTTL